VYRALALVLLAACGRLGFDDGSGGTVSTNAGNAVRALGVLGGKGRKTDGTLTSQQAGDTLLAFARWRLPAVHVASLVDSAGDTFTPIGEPDIGTNACVEAFVAPGIVAADSNLVTLMFDGTTEDIELRVLEYANIDVSDPVEASTGMTGSGVALVTGAVTTTRPALIVALAIGANRTAPGEGFTVDQSYHENIVESKDAEVAGNYAAAASQAAGGAWVMHAVALALP